MAQVVACLPSKHEVLNLNPSTAKKKKKKRERERERKGGREGGEEKKKVVAMHNEIV
jgi:hypothetical protein